MGAQCSDAKDATPGVMLAKPLVWSAAEYGTGIKLIDEQHKGLFTCLSELSDCLKEKDMEKQRQMIIKAIDTLIQYTVTHFKAEVSASVLAVVVFLPMNHSQHNHLRKT